MGWITNCITNSVSFYCELITFRWPTDRLLSAEVEYAYRWRLWWWRLKRGFLSIRRSLAAIWAVHSLWSQDKLEIGSCRRYWRDNSLCFPLTQSFHTGTIPCLRLGAFPLNFVRIVSVFILLIYFRPIATRHIWIGLLMDHQTAMSYTILLPTPRTPSVKITLVSRKLSRYCI
jgi:hypothetical protein